MYFIPRMKRCSNIRKITNVIHNKENKGENNCSENHKALD